MSVVVAHFDVHPGLVLFVSRAQCPPHRAIALEAAAEGNLPNPVTACQPLPGLNICQHVPGKNSDIQP